MSPSSLLLASDFDGTLAPIVERPGEAVILPEALTALRSLRPRLQAIALISGRTTADLRERVPLAGLTLLGDYGLTEPSPTDLEALDTFNREAAEAVAEVRGAGVEPKAASTSVHFRSAPEAGPRLMALLEPLASAAHLQIRPGRLVREVMPRGGNKEAALERLIEERRPGAVIWAGDDSGDQNGFELVSGLRIPHLAVGVLSEEAPAEIFSSCDVLVDGPEGAARLLSRLAGWASRAGRGRAGRGSGG